MQVGASLRGIVLFAKRNSIRFIILAEDANVLHPQMRLRASGFVVAFTHPKKTFDESNFSINISIKNSEQQRKAFKGFAEAYEKGCRACTLLLPILHSNFQPSSFFLHCIFRTREYAFTAEQIYRQQMIQSSIMRRKFPVFSSSFFSVFLSVLDIEITEQSSDYDVRREKEIFFMVEAKLSSLWENIFPTLFHPLHPSRVRA